MKINGVETGYVLRVENIESRPQRRVVRSPSPDENPPETPRRRSPSPTSHFNNLNRKCNVPRSDGPCLRRSNLLTDAVLSGLNIFYSPPPTPPRVRPTRERSAAEEVPEPHWPWSSDPGRFPTIERVHNSPRQVHHTDRNGSAMDPGIRPLVCCDRSGALNILEPDGTFVRWCPGPHPRDVLDTVWPPIQQSVDPPRRHTDVDVDFSTSMAPPRRHTDPDVEYRSRRNMTPPRRHTDVDVESGSSTSNVSTTGQPPWLKNFCPTTADPPRKAKTRPPKGGAKIGLKTAQSTPVSSKDPRILLAQALDHLGSAHWEDNITGFEMLRRLLRAHAEFLHCELSTINRAALAHLTSLRSQVARAACDLFGELIVTFGKSMEKDSEKIAESLLDKTSDMNKFMRKASTSALESMVTHLAPSRVLVPLESYGAGHPHPMVRNSTAHLVHLFIQHLGSERAGREFSQRLLPMLISFLQEGNLETREHAKSALSCLALHVGFEYAIKRFIQPEALKLVEKQIVAIKNNAYVEMLQTWRVEYRKIRDGLEI